MTSRPLLFTLVLLLSPGCAIKTTVGLMDADQAVRAAVDAGGDELATHDTTMARAYLVEAHRQWGRSRYASADQLAAEALRYAEQASQKSAVGGDPGQLVPDEVEVVPDVEAVGPQQEEPDDAELMELIEQDKGESPERQPSMMEEEQLDAEIFEEEAE